MKMSVYLLLGTLIIVHGFYIHHNIAVAPLLVLSFYPIYILCCRRAKQLGIK
jgi:hypothetical protein